MAEGAGVSGADWVREPIAPGELRIKIDVGEQVELTSALRHVLEQLVHELASDEVSGFADTDPDRPPCGDLNGCTAFSCDLGRCQPLDRFPCAWNIGCTISPTMRR
jgi:hypothetical protein